MNWIREQKNGSVLTTMLRTLVSAGELFLSCARLLAGWVTTLWLSHGSANMANSAIYLQGSVNE